MKSLSLLAEKYQEVQFSNPVKIVAACTPHQLLQAITECSKGHDLKAIFNYVAESNENGNSLVTESLIEENTEVAATILAVEKILSYYVEAKDEKFNKEVKEALTRGKRANGQPTSTSANVNPANVQQGFPKPAPAPAQQVGIAGDPVNTPQAAAPQAGAQQNPPAQQSRGIWGGLKNAVGKGIEYLGKAAGKFGAGVSAGAQSVAGAGQAGAPLPYENIDTQADLSALTGQVSTVSNNDLVKYGVTPEALQKLKAKQIGGITLSNKDKHAEISVANNGLYTIKSLTPAEIDAKNKAADTSPADPAAKAAAKAPVATDPAPTAAAPADPVTTAPVTPAPVTPAPVTPAPVTPAPKRNSKGQLIDTKGRFAKKINSSFNYNSNKVLKEFYQNGKPLPIENINK